MIFYDFQTSFFRDKKKDKSERGGKKSSLFNATISFGKAKNYCWGSKFLLIYGAFCCRCHHILLRIHL